MSRREGDMPDNIEELFRQLRPHGEGTPPSPPSPPSEPPKGGRRINRRRMGQVLVGSVVGLGVLAAGYAAKEKGLIPGVSPSRAPVIDFPKEFEWSHFKSAVDGVSQQYRALRNGGRSQEEINAASRDVIKRGVDLYNRGPNTYPVEMAGPDSLMVFDNNFDLRTQHGMVFGGAALYVELAAIHKDASVTSRTPYTADLDVRVLADKMTVMDSDSAPFVDPVNLSYLHLLFKTADKAGMGNPKTWKQTEGIQKWDPNEQVMHFRGDNVNILTAWARFHATQDRALVDDLQGILGKVAHGEQNIDLVTMPKNGFGIHPDEFASGVFLKYVTAGVDFERRARALETMISPNGAALVREQRDRLKDKFNGVEFGYDGVQREPQPQYAENQLVAAVNIKSAMRRMIALEKISEGDPADQSAKVIQEKTILELMSGPQRIIDTTQALATDYWIVSAGQYLSGGRWVSGANHPRGMIPSEFLGRVVGTAR